MFSVFVHLHLHDPGATGDPGDPGGLLGEGLEGVHVVQLLVQGVGCMVFSAGCIVKGALCRGQGALLKV